MHLTDTYNLLFHRIYFLNGSLQTFFWKKETPIEQKKSYAVRGTNGVTSCSSPKFHLQFRFSLDLSLFPQWKRGLNKVQLKNFCDYQHINIETSLPKANIFNRRKLHIHWYARIALFSQSSWIIKSKTLQSIRLVQIKLPFLIRSCLSLARLSRNDVPSERNPLWSLLPPLYHFKSTSAGLKTSLDHSQNEDIESTLKEI